MIFTVFLCRIFARICRICNRICHICSRICRILGDRCVRGFWRQILVYTLLTYFLVFTAFVASFSNKHHYDRPKILRMFCFYYFCPKLLFPKLFVPKVEVFLRSSRININHDSTGQCHSVHTVRHSVVLVGLIKIRQNKLSSYLTIIQLI